MRWLVVAGILLASVAQGQETGWLVGAVTERDSIRALAGAHVVAGHAACNHR